MTAWLSAAHVIGLTLVMSGGVWNLRATGDLLNAQPAEFMTRPAARELPAGLTISLITGLILFTPRAPGTVVSDVFQLKMTLILAAAALQLALSFMVAKPATLSLRWLRAGGVLSEPETRGSLQETVAMVRRRFRRDVLSGAAAIHRLGHVGVREHLLPDQGRRHDPRGLQCHRLFICC